MLEEIGQMDIYLLDQVMKGRIQKGMRILDAGCGSGRNSEYFVKKDFDIYGIDKDEEAITQVRESVASWNPGFDKLRFKLAHLEQIPFSSESFDYIISSAVLHFSENREHFTRLFEETIRVLKPKGTVFIRMTTKHTLAHLSHRLLDDVFMIPDGTTRYLLDVGYLKILMEKHHLSFVDPFKTVNVSDLRTMAVVILHKEK